MKNILISSAGRRVELVQEFKEQASLLVPDSRVHAIDCFPELSAACHVAGFVAHSPHATDPDFPAFLMEYCVKNKIGLVIPTIDTELAVLSACREQFISNGIHIVVSSPKIIARCRDKRETGDLFAALDIRYPKIYQRDELRFPCFAKPYNGSCSKGARIILNSESLPLALLQDSSMMYMELIDKSYSEYTVDAYYDRDGSLKCLVPRKRLEVRAGEISKGVTRRGNLYEFLHERLNYVPGAVGCLTVQLFVNEAANDYIGLEINPRFGGGYPLSYAAGALYPGWLIKEYLLGEKIAFFDEWEKDLMMLRYDAQVLVHNAT